MNQVEQKWSHLLSFNVTPVRQSVRRINSFLEYSRQPVRWKLAGLTDAASPLVKSVSCDSALPSCTSKEPSASCAKSGPNQQQSPSSGQSNMGATSKSSMELTSKSSSKMKTHQSLWMLLFILLEFVNRRSNLVAKLRFPWMTWLIMI